MTYYIINNKPVFLTKYIYKKLFLIISKDKSPLWKISSRISGQEIITGKENIEKIEKDELIYNLLNNDFLANPENFINNWVEFDLKGKEASENIKNLLEDHYYLYWYGYLESYPRWTVFTINYFVRPAKWWWKYINKMKWKEIQITIDPNTVTNIKWNLKEFTIYMWNFKIIFGEKLSISAF